MATHKMDDALTRFGKCLYTVISIGAGKKEVWIFTMNRNGDFIGKKIQIEIMNSGKSTTKDKFVNEVVIHLRQCGLRDGNKSYIAVYTIRGFRKMSVQLSEFIPEKNTTRILLRAIDNPDIIDDLTTRTTPQNTILVSDSCDEY